jgi:hypothetical protein
MSQKDVRLYVYHKNIARVKKIFKKADDSGPVAVCVRVAPTLAAVPRRRA